MNAIQKSKDIRTERGKLVGKLEEQTGIFSIKDGVKLTLIEVPLQGLHLKFTPGDGVMEEVYISPVKRETTTKTA